ncbi:hypothetical protein G5714_004329 [Onychostoma macrolepis]|uniref:Pyrin domain-containing protein n=1 Tax=Onychostoma macrolepis TaxID=369639 RepID=A0A7J6D4E9_9TELE|nr:hypothetical protein G5714_004329 [Onychostoma macrolepis]
MASVEDLLLKSLRNLVEDELKEFQWYLEKDHECISKSEMENANRLKTVDKVVACFGPEEAVTITVVILRKMNHNHLADQLEKNHKQVDKAPVQKRSSAQPESHVVNIRAENGTSVNAPVMIGNNFSGSVTFNK